MAEGITSKRQRNVPVELLRILAMLMVVACHATIHLNWGLLSSTGWNLAFADLVVQGGQVGVAVFFMITGYYMVDKGFRPSRIVSVWLQVVAYSVCCLLVMAVATLCCEPFSFLAPQFEGWELVTTLQKELMPVTSRAYWFVTAYVGLLLVSPFLNDLFRHMPERGMIALTVGLVLATSMFVVAWRLSHPSSLYKAIVCYLVGGCLRCYPSLAARATKARSAAVFVLCLLGLLLFDYAAKMESELLAWAGWPSNWSEGPWALWILAAASLVAFATSRSWSPSARTARLICILSSATFGVYLLHENYLGYQVLWRAVAGLVQVPAGSMAKVVWGGAIVLVVFAVLLACSCVLDALLVRPLRRASRCLTARLDAKVLTLLTKSTS